MASSAVASATARYRVTLKGHPLQGFEDYDGSVYESRPTEIHYRPDQRHVHSASGQPVDPENWYSERELCDLYGYDKPPAKWLKRRRPRTDLTSRNYRSWVVEASSEHEARARFMERFKIRDAKTDNWSVEQVSEDTPLGLCDPAKKQKQAAA